MLVELDRQGLLNLVHGTHVSYEKAPTLIEQGIGDWVSINPDWGWKLDDSISDKQLLEIYLYLK
jgi:hypothetical protein